VDIPPEEMIIRLETAAEEETQTIDAWVNKRNYLISKFIHEGERVNQDGGTRLSLPSSTLPSDIMGYSRHNEPMIIEPLLAEYPS
jgi:hypothetical protein